MAGLARRGGVLALRVSISNLCMREYAIAPAGGLAARRIYETHHIQPDVENVAWANH